MGRNRQYVGCLESGCPRPHKALGLCATHYARLLISRPEERKKRRERSARARRDPEFRAKRRVSDRERWTTDESYRASVLAKRAESRADPVRNAQTRATKRFACTGFTIALVLACRKLQDDCCAICTREFDRSRGRGAAVECADHWEPEGVKTPRGLLCSICNQALGHYEKHQRPAGLRIGPYEGYLSDTPVMRLQRAP